MRKIIVTLSLILLSLNLVAQTNYSFFSKTDNNTFNLYYKITKEASPEIPGTVRVVSEISKGGYTSELTGTLVIPDTVVNNAMRYIVTEIGDDAFYQCLRLEGSLAIPNTVTEIGDHAFYYCGFKGDLIMPNSVKTIGISTFQGGDFTGNLILPNAVTSIGTSAFGNCDAFTGDLIIPNSLKEIGDHTFGRCDGLTGSLTIPSTVKTIADEAFYSCGFTGKLVIPNSVTAIGQGAFKHCTGFTGNLTIPNSVKTIDGDAFSYCTGFTGSLSIPNSVTEIGSYAFAACANLTGTLTLPNQLVKIGDAAFSGCKSLEGTLTIPNSVKIIGDFAFIHCTGLTGSLIIPNTVTTIGDHAFRGCTELVGNLNIPNAVIAIGDYAFSECTGLTGSLSIPNTVKTIGDHAFSGCTGLDGSLTLSNAVTTIGDHAFSGCTGLKGSLIMPNTLREIGSYAFANCSGFSGSLNIPSSVTTIGYNAFLNIEAIDIHLLGIAPPRMQSTTFAGISKDISITIPCNTLVEYKNANYWCYLTNYYESTHPITIQANNENAYDSITRHNSTCDNDTVKFQIYPSVGYEFLNWSDGDKNNPRTHKLTADATFTAILTHNYTVAFYANNGTTDDTTQSFIYGGDSVALIANRFEKEGATFMGWGADVNAKEVVYQDQAKVKDLTTEKGDTVRLYAVWEKVYTIEFLSNNDLDNRKYQNFVYDADSVSLEKNTFEKIDYTFMGWATNASATTVLYRDQANIKNLSSVNKDTIQLYAVWELSSLVKYTVTFDNSGGIGTMQAQEFTANIAQKLKPNTFGKAGHTFKGWSTIAWGEVDLADEFLYTAIADITLYAVWEATPVAKYMVTFNNSGGIGTMQAQEFTADIAQKLKPNTFEKVSHTFKGWAITAGGAANMFDEALYTAIADITLYAVWEVTPVAKYMVTFNNNGGTGTMQAQEFTANIAQTLNPNTFEKVGNTFKGWAITAGGEANMFDEALYTAIADITLYAVWEATVDIATLNEKPTLSIYPNPAVEYLYVENYSPNTERFIIHNTTGKIELQQRCTSEISTSLQIGHLKPGFYMLQICSKGEVLQVMKFIKK